MKMMKMKYWQNAQGNPNDPKCKSTELGIFHCMVPKALSTMFQVCLCIFVERYVSTASMQMSDVFHEAP